MGQMRVTENSLIVPSAARCRRYFVALVIICATFLSLLLHAQQYLEGRILEFEAQGKYAEALALCVTGNGTNSAFATFLAGEYYFHGRKGIPKAQKKGQVYYLR